MTYLLGYLVLSFSIVGVVFVLPVLIYESRTWIAHKLTTRKAHREAMKQALLLD